MRRMGIMKNADGTFSTSICRAKLGNEGKFGCHHFVHRNNADEAKSLLLFLEKHKDEFKDVDMTADSLSLTDSFRNYLTDKMDVDPESLASDDPRNWFPDEKSYEDSLARAVGEDGMPSMRVCESLHRDIAALAGAGVSTQVVADRTIGMKESCESDTDVWMKANGIGSHWYSDDAVLTVMVDGPDGESAAAARARRTFEPPRDVNAGVARRRALATLGYASVH